MTIVMTLTDRFILINGEVTRVWEGVTLAGVPCEVFARYIFTGPGADVSEFEREMTERTGSVSYARVPADPGKN